MRDAIRAKRAARCWNGSSIPARRRCKTNSWMKRSLTCAVTHPPFHIGAEICLDVSPDGNLSIIYAYERKEVCPHNNWLRENELPSTLWRTLSNQMLHGNDHSLFYCWRHSKCRVLVSMTGCASKTTTASNIAPYSTRAYICLLLWQTESVQQ